MYEKLLTADYWNGINLAFLYNERASITENPQEVEANRVMATRAMQKVLEICRRLVTGFSPLSPRLAGAWGRDETATNLEQANSLNPAQWTLKTTSTQLQRLRKLLLTNPSSE